MNDHEQILRRYLGESKDKSDFAKLEQLEKALTDLAHIEGVGTVIRDLQEIAFQVRKREN